MDRWKYRTESGRKESGFENLKTRFQDCNLSRKQESKPDGMIERKLSFNRESKLSAKENKLSLQKDNKKQGKRKRSHSGFRAFNMERKENHPSICTDGMK